jgi:hypothetical protein
LSDPEIEDFRLDDPTIEALFYRLNEAEVAVVMAQRHQALIRQGLPAGAYTNAELIEEARRSIKLADDMAALAGRWKF